MNKNMRDQVIIIPTFQPSEKLINLVKKLRENFCKVLVVDDGSGEQYSSIFKKVTEINCIVLKHAVNQGKGRALKTAFNYCLNNSGFASGGVVTVDGDGQHTLTDVIRIAEELAIRPDTIIMGYRQFDSKSIPLRSRIGNNISRLVYKWACGIDLRDTQTGLRGLPFSYLEYACAVEGERYEYETNMLISIKDNGFSTYEIPIETIYEGGNEESHFNPLKDSVKIYLVIIKYCISSLLTVLVDYCLFAILITFGFSIVLGTYTARLGAAVVNFSVNRNVVFKYRGNIVIQFLKYALLVFASGTISGMAIMAITNAIGVNVMICKIIVETLLFFANYYVQSRYIFVRDK